MYSSVRLLWDGTAAKSVFNHMKISCRRGVWSRCLSSSISFSVLTFYESFRQLKCCEMVMMLCWGQHTDPFSPDSPWSPCQGKDINECFTVASTVSTHILLSAWTSKAGFSRVDNSPGLLALQVFLQHLQVPKIKEHDRFWHFSVICTRFSNRCNIRTYQTYLVSLRTIETDGTLRKKWLLLNLMIKKRFIFSNNCFADFCFHKLGLDLILTRSIWLNFYSWSSLLGFDHFWLLTLNLTNIWGQYSGLLRFIH